MGQVPYELIGRSVGTNNGKILEPIRFQIHQFLYLEKAIVGISLYI